MRRVGGAEEGFDAVATGVEVQLPGQADIQEEGPTADAGGRTFRGWPSKTLAASNETEFYERMGLQKIEVFW